MSDIRSMYRWVEGVEYMDDCMIECGILLE